MKLLLDTHVWIWSQERLEALGPRTRRLLVAAGHENFVSPISTLEIARLVVIDAIALAVPLRQWITDSMADLAAKTLPLTHQVAMDAYALPGEFHRDPADRMLVAAARGDGLTLVTADDRILAYPHARTHDARQ